MDGRKLNNSTLAHPFSSAKFVLPPRYGVTVVSTPPPTVRLYVSDVGHRNSADDDEDLEHNPAKTKVNSVKAEILSSPSSDPISSGGDAPAGSGSAGGDGGAALNTRTAGSANNCVNPSQRRCSQPNDRKLSASGGDSGNATTTSGTKPEVSTTTTTTDVKWLTDNQGKAGPLPFPPVHITFDDNNESDAGAGGGMSSCDSIHQSTETVVMRDAAAAARKAAAAVRRKSVYYNATPEPTTATSASSDADLVTLPRLKQRHHHHHHHHQRHPHRGAGDPEVEKVTSLDRAGSRRHASKTESAGGGSGRRRKLAVFDVVGGQEVTSSMTSSSQQQHNPAAIRVSRSTVHSDSRVAVDVTNPAANVRLQSPDTLRPHAAASNPAVNVVKPRVPPSSSTFGTSAASTMRTYGPACVTITPLTTVDECARFPVVTPRERSRQQLDPTELLRSEYEVSFGGEVNPLLLYSTGAGASGVVEQEVNLSKQTVYDNVQYFNM